MAKHCLKGTPFMCPCDDCMAELFKRALAHNQYMNNLRSNMSQYWSDQYSAHDKEVTMIHVGAGHEPDPHCYCLRCQVARDQQEVMQ